MERRSPCGHGGPGPGPPEADPRTGTPATLRSRL